MNVFNDLFRLVYFNWFYITNITDVTFNIILHTSTFACYWRPKCMMGTCYFHVGWDLSQSWLIKAIMMMSTFYSININILPFAFHHIRSYSYVLAKLRKISDNHFWISWTIWHTSQWICNFVVLNKFFLRSSFYSRSVKYWRKLSHIELLKFIRIICIWGFKYIWQFHLWLH